MTAIERYLQKKFKFDAAYFIRGGFWSTLGQVIGIVGGVITTSLFAYYLSPEDYGVYKYLIMLGVIFSSLSLTGIGQSILQSAAKGYAYFYPRGVRLSLKYNIGAILLSITAAGYYFFHDNYTLAIGCILIALFQPFINSFGNYPSFLQGSKKFRENTYFLIIKTIFIAAVSIISILITKNILVLLLVYLASNAFINFVLYFFTRPKLTQEISQEIIDKYTNYAKHTSIQNFLTNIATRLDSIIIFQQLGAAELAIYTIANIIPHQIKGSLKNISSLILPKFAKYNNIEDIKEIILRKGILLFLVLCVIMVLYVLLVPFLYHFLFPKYEEAIFLSQLSALAFPAFILFLPMGALKSQMKKKELYILNIISNVISIVLTVVLILLYGVLGAILAKILYRYINAFVSFYIILHKT